jgi:ABC-type transporter Mla MlaB component
VAFSFIRKKFSPSTHPHLPQVEASAQQDTGFDLTQLSIEVIDNESQLNPAQEEAAMLHSGGQSDAALQFLHSEIKQIIGLRQTETWLMLFELLQQANKKTLFDEIALQYVLEFEKTPPIWREAQAKIQQEHSNYYVFSAYLNGQSIDQEIATFYAACQGCNSLRMDLAKVMQIDTIAAAELLAAWQRCTQQEIKLQLLGHLEVEALLRGLIKTGRAIPAEAPLWLLLIELQQIQGLQNEFENLAVDYAITFEVSPPSWIASKHESPIQLTYPHLNPYSNPDRLLIEGDLLNSKPELIAIIRDFVRLHAFPVLDFSHVMRVDFDSAGQLLSLCMEYPEQVTFCNVNALVLALFRIMGLTELVILSLSSQQ